MPCVACSSSSSWPNSRPCAPISASQVLISVSSSHLVGMLEGYPGIVRLRTTLTSSTSNNPRRDHVCHHRTSRAQGRNLEHRPHALRGRLLRTPPHGVQGPRHLLPLLGGDHHRREAGGLVGRGDDRGGFGRHP